MKFYTYIYRDPSRDNEPIYVGKGHGRRAWKHLNRKGKHPFIQRLHFMSKSKIKPDIEIIYALDEIHAFFMEECCISVLGRKDLGKGPLLNLTDGGEGMSNPSDQTRLRIGQANKGIKRTEEQIKINSESRKGKPNGRAGITYKQKDTTNHGNRNKIRTQEFKDNLSKLHTGKVAWNKGKVSMKKECIYCKVWMDPGNLRKYHNENCKFKE
jgi:hypothetical protein